ncbi:MAG: hypothetical protein HQ519_10630 [Planctomycetes bacterium]|nr:hypothetical protein [Planctomycetota bacterium]
MNNDTKGIQHSNSKLNHPSPALIEVDQPTQELAEPPSEFAHWMDIRLLKLLTEKVDAERHILEASELLTEKHDLMTDWCLIIEGQDQRPDAEDRFLRRVDCFWNDEHRFWEQDGRIDDEAMRLGEEEERLVREQGKLMKRVAEITAEMEKIVQATQAVASIKVDPATAEGE